ncbi:2-oxoglutarate dehydrogenase E1 component [Candidatus Latescibacterota bacterium]
MPQLRPAMISPGMDSANREYIETLHEQYHHDPQSVGEQWQRYFEDLDSEYSQDGQGGDVTPSQQAAERPARVAPTPRRADPAPARQVIDRGDGGEPTYAGPERRKRERTDKGGVAIVRAYRHRGHYLADVDPLGNNRTTYPYLELSQFGITEEDLDKGVGFGTFRGKTDGSLRDLIDKLKISYCGTLGIDTMGTADTEQERWLEERIEPTLNQPSFTPSEKRRILWQLLETEEFERFLHTRYIGQKRFSIEGSEGLLPLLDTLVVRGSAVGVEEMAIGMSHRGRLNVLAHILHKPYEVLLSEFEGSRRSEDSEDEGDVKYHQGYSYDFVTREGKRMHLSLAPNPSHLELVNPVIEGIVRSKQDYLHDRERARVVPVQIHGEAAFTGQGIVAETLNLSQIQGYWNGGTVHIIVNNQLGYTATPEETRFTAYPTDVARQIQAPIFHVNADDPEQIVRVARLAIEFRHEFKRDVIVDLVCYRRHGHNEADDPTVTQPLLYKQIASHLSAAQIYGRRLIEQGEITEEEVEEMRAEVRETLDRCQEKAHHLHTKPRINTFGGVWQGISWAGDDWDAETAVHRKSLQRIAIQATRAPEHFHLHRTVERLNAARREMVEGKQPVDWGCAEMLAFGSLLRERIPVRLAGQDSQRGTFAHRHAVWHDVDTGEKYVPLANLAADQAEFAVLNTMLSELAVLGYEYGMSSADPRRLIIWEAQFGDFANGAQAIIDQYIASAEAKWHRMSGIVLLLPHGYEGQGPEHSSARLERYLQLCAKSNLQVCYPSTPSQLFHAIRRQMHRSFRKPLVLMTPKSLLRHKACVSDIDELARGSFRTVIDDPGVEDPSSVRRVLLCTGKLYYELQAGLESREVEGLAVVRVEQLYPFPEAQAREVVERYEQAEEYLWVQEEAANMGAWYFIQPLLDELLPEGVALRYVGRDEAASPAVGDHQQHQIEQRDIVDQALDLRPRELVLEDLKPSRLEAEGSGSSA